MAKSKNDEVVSTGLYHNYHRDYDPSIGQYIQADPIGLNGGMGLYLYANDNPIMYIDPLGLLVHAVLDATEHTLTIVDLDTRETIKVNNVFTGGNSHNKGVIVSPGTGKQVPAPEGKYYITRNPNIHWGSGDDKWFGLLYKDDKIDDYHDGRSGIRLHGGLVSEGCVTVSKWGDEGRQNWDKVSGFITNTKYDYITYENSIRWKRFWEPAPDYSIRHYGELEIINIPKN